MNVLFLIWATFTVSLDSFFCGLTARMKSDDRLKTFLGVCVTVFLLCALGATLGSVISNNLKKWFEFLSGISLFIIGYKDFFETPPLFLGLTELKYDTLKKAITLGLSIGIDGAIGCFSLVLSGFNPALVTLFITAMHLLLLSTAFSVGGKIKSVYKLKTLPPILLMLLGAYKCASVFI